MLLGGDQRRVGGREGGISQRLDVASRAHSSSAICGVKGAIISTSGSTTSRGEPVPAATPVRWLLSVISLATAVLNRRLVRSFRTPAIVRWSSRRMVSYSGGAEDKALERGLLFRREIIARLEEHGR